MIDQTVLPPSDPFIPPVEDKSYHELLTRQALDRFRPMGPSYYSKDANEQAYKPFGSYDDYLRSDQIQNYVRSQNQGVLAGVSNAVINTAASFGAYVLETPFAFIGAIDGALNPTAGKSRMASIAAGAGGNNPVINEIQGALNAFKDNYFPIPTSRDYDEGNIISKMGTTSWLFKDFADGVAFLGAAWATGKGLGAVLGELGSISKGVENIAKATDTGVWAKGLAEGAGKVFKTLDKFGINTQNLLTNVVNTPFEAGQEANEAKNKSDAYFDAKIAVAQAMGELGEVKALQHQKELTGDDVMASVFTTNYAILSLSNVWESDWINNSFKPASISSRKEIMSKLAEVETSAWTAAGGEVGPGAAKIVDDVFQQAIKRPPSRARAFVLGSFAEAGYEENTQAATQNYFYNKYVLGKGKDNDSFDDFVSIAGQSAKNLKAFAFDLTALPVAAITLGHIRAP